MKNSLTILISIVSFALSLIFAPYHINGDQEHYTNAYRSMNGLGLIDAFDVYRTSIFSFEPVHFLLSWVFTNLDFDKNIAMAALNSLLAFLFSQFLFDRTKSCIIVLLLVFSNQYLYSFFFTLEKLKISVIFLLFFLNYRIRFFGFIAALAHFQVALLLCIYFAASKFSKIGFHEFSKIFRLRNLPSLLILSIISIGFWVLFSDYVIQKVLFYNDREEVGGVVSLVPLVLVFFGTILSSNQDRTIITWYFAILALFIYLLGGDRMNMFAYFGFLYFAAYRKFNSFKEFVSLIFILFSIVFLGYKSFAYLNMVVTYGG